MIKLGNISNRLPGGEGVAVLAGKIQITVRAPRGGIALAVGLRRSVLLPLRRQRTRTAQQEPDDQVYQQC